MPFQSIAWRQKRRAAGLTATFLLTLFALGSAYFYWTAAPLNVVLITFDTTRADHLGIYGYQRGLTSGFDSIAEQGVIFERAYAPAPVTLPSHATMLTGLYPPEHGLRVNGIGRLPDTIPLLPEILKKRGYDTAAFVAAFVLDSKFGLERGFDTYDDDLSNAKVDGHFGGERRREGKSVVDSALSWLRQRTSRPFFCWIHLYDAHALYNPRPEQFGSFFEQTPYDAGIAVETQQFQRVMTFLEEQKLRQKTLVVVAGDHGEGLDEHSEFEHGMLLYNTTLHVPLAFIGPRHCRPAHRVTNTVSLVDITPTILDIVGVPAPAHVSGRSLRLALAGESISSRACYAETETPFLYNHWHPLHAVISDRWKFIQTARPELYDLENDPGEVTNLFESAGEDSQQMQNVLETLQEGFVLTSVQNLILTEREKNTLQALGYVTGGKLPSDPNELNAEALPDVKDMLPYLEKFDTARHLSVKGDVEGAIKLFQEICHATDQFPAAYFFLGECLDHVGRLDAAIAAYRRGLELRPEFVKAHMNLGRIFVTRNEFQQAIDEFREVVKQEPDTGAPHFELAQTLVKLQRFAEAEAEFRLAIRCEPDFVVAHVQLGLLLAIQKHPDKAISCFEEAIKYDPNRADAHSHLARILASKGQLDRALEHSRKAALFDPSSFDAHFHLATLLISQRQFREAIAQLNEAARLRPDDQRPPELIRKIEAVLHRNSK